MTDAFTREQFMEALRHEERQMAQLCDDGHPHWAVVREALRLAADANHKPPSDGDYVMVPTIAALFEKLGEPDHRLARWTYGAPPFEFWSRRTIETALAELAAAPSPPRPQEITPSADSVERAKTLIAEAIKAKHIGAKLMPDKKIALWCESGWLADVLAAEAALIEMGVQAVEALLTERDEIVAAAPPQPPTIEQMAWRIVHNELPRWWNAYTRQYPNSKLPEKDLRELAAHACVIAALSQPQEGSGEPVAWRWRWKETDPWRATCLEPDADTPSEPLFAHPSPAPSGDLRGDVEKLVDAWGAFSDGRQALKFEIEALVQSQVDAAAKAERESHVETLTLLEEAQAACNSGADRLMEVVAERDAEREGREKAEAALRTIAYADVVPGGSRMFARASLTSKATESVSTQTTEPFAWAYIGANTRRLQFEKSRVVIEDCRLRYPETEIISLYDDATLQSATSTGFKAGIEAAAGIVKAWHDQDGCRSEARVALREVEHAIRVAGTYAVPSAIRSASTPDTAEGGK